ncbi:MAG: CsbD family protein [Acidobacteriia bacterium]|nr:CsbD family protein [Terriglobia bacterium]
MEPSTKDQITGKLHEMKGRVKLKAGQVTNDPTLAAEGQDEKLAGKIQKKVGQIERVFEK